MEASDIFEHGVLRQRNQLCKIGSVALSVANWIGLDLDVAVER
jgi:hypothetical protein